MLFRQAPLVRALAPCLGSGGIGVLPTDTIYGVVGSALLPKAVARIYSLRRRDRKKPMIILIADMKDIGRFGVQPDVKTKKTLRRLWPGKVSIILPIAPRRKSMLAKFRYLHRGTGSLAFRVPDLPWLRELLRNTGPLIAPSANHEGEAPAQTVREAKKYFGDRVAFYVDAGRKKGNPSTLIRIADGTVTVLRKSKKKLISRPAHFRMI